MDEIKELAAKFSAKFRFGDKILHFGMGLVIAILMSAGGAPNLAALAAIGVGVAKEFKDKKDGGKFDNLDLIATGVGGVFGQVVYYVQILPLLMSIAIGG